MPLSPKSLAGPGYVILNTLRVMNITALMAMVAANIVMLAKTVIDTHFFFFDAVSHVITILISIFLAISEIGLFRKYFARNWPVLSASHGFVSLGLAMLVLGIGLLGQLNRQDLSEDRLGLAFWRILIGAGVLILILGIFNIIASYIFRDRAAGVTARQVRAKGAVAVTQARSQASCKSFNYPSTSSSAAGSQKETAWSQKEVVPVLTDYPPMIPPMTPPNPKKRSTFRFSRFGRPVPVLPSYHTSPPAASSRYTFESESEREMEISAPMNINPQFAHLVRPNSAYHPSNRR